MQKKKRKIAVVTGSRAEYGLLYWLLREINEDSGLELQLVATCMHLSTEFGLTYREIEQDGFTISAKVEMLVDSDNSVGVVKSVGLGVIGFADAFNNLDPDLVIMLGDRFEILAAAEAAFLLKKPIAHIHGGEITEGALDDSIRHAVTKLANYHFAAAEPYRQRIIQLGEQPNMVFNFGAPGLDHITKTDFFGREELEQELDVKLSKQNFLITYHPVTASQKEYDIAALEAVFVALSDFPEAKIIFTKTNADERGRLINKKIDAFVKKHADRMKAFVSLGYKRYMSAVKCFDVVIGNSSSGLIEVPYLQKPTVNIGIRQQNRLLANSVINCEENASAISGAIKKALSEEFKQTVCAVKSPYGEGNASQRIKEFLKNCNLDVSRKQFYDQGVK
jgi:UDP-hydrolysing UDP-N-acetyl-D-glucosamine 2-epimerase